MILVDAEEVYILARHDHCTRNQLCRDTLVSLCDGAAIVSTCRIVLFISHPGGVEASSVDLRHCGIVKH